MFLLFLHTYITSLNIVEQKIDLKNNNFEKDTVQIFNSHFRDIQHHSLSISKDIKLRLQENSFVQSATPFENQVYNHTLKFNRTVSTVSNCRFIECRGLKESPHGGAMNIHSQSNITILNCIFNTCSQMNGGAIACVSSNLECHYTNFTQNIANLNGVGFFTESLFQMSYIIAISNDAQDNTGCFSFYSESVGSITNSAILSNEADSMAGGISIDTSAVFFDKDYFIQNHSDNESIPFSSGAIYIYDACETITINGCVFIQNSLFNDMPRYITVIGNSHIILTYNIFDIDINKSISTFTGIGSAKNAIPQIETFDSTVDVDPTNPYFNLIQPEGGLKRYKMNFETIQSRWFSVIIFFAVIVSLCIGNVFLWWDDITSCCNSSIDFIANDPIQAVMAKRII